MHSCCAVALQVICHQQQELFVVVVTGGRRRQSSSFSSLVPKNINICIVINAMQAIGKIRICKGQTIFRLGFDHTVNQNKVTILTS